MGGQLALIHTVPGLIAVFEPLVHRHLPGWTPFNIVDESLLRISIREGSMSKATARRVAGYVFSAVDAGADAILVTCSSIGGAVDAARPFCPVPLVRVDEGMAERAVVTGRRIGVLATLTSTLDPTRDLIARIAAERGASSTISASVVDGAFAALAAGRQEEHDRRVGDALKRRHGARRAARRGGAPGAVSRRGAPARALRDAVATERGRSLSSSSCRRRH